WRYYLTPENQLEIQQPKLKTEVTKTLNIFEKPKSPEVKKSKSVERKTKKTSKNDKFFNKVKSFLSAKSTEILDIESFSKNELVLRIKKDDQEEILIAYNKKRINEEDILKAHRKISGKYSGYKILCLGEPLKRTKNIINAIKDLREIDKMSEDK
ncbi:hypothetical protein KAT24_03005, partial [Candidatus Pacearchaeota archaeon]|nr:hypothetical protein [Candidatus Pacearchaeota archaeon]